MKILIIGGAGYVGSIVRPALESHYTCYYLDLKPIADAGDRCIVGSVSDTATVQRAMEGMDVVVWLVLGLKPGLKMPEASQDLDAAFDVNVRDLFRALQAAHSAGVPRFVYASSLSIYRKCYRRDTYPLDDNQEADAWDAYGMSKRVGEMLGAAWAQQSAQSTFLGLRLLRPRNENDWPGHEYTLGRTWYPIGPNDARRLFVAAVAFDSPGFYLMQASGDLGSDTFPNTRVIEVLGWRPEGN